MLINKMDLFDEIKGEYIETEVLVWACRKGKIEIVKKLINDGCSPTKSTQESYYPMEAASYRGHLDIVKFLIKKGCSPLDALYCVCKKDHLNIVEYIIFTFPDINLSAAMNYAVGKGNIDIVKHLLENKSQICDHYYNISMHVENASQFGRFNILNLFDKECCNTRTKYNSYWWMRRDIRNLKCMQKLCPYEMLEILERKYGKVFTSSEIFKMLIEKKY